MLLRLVPCDGLESYTVERDSVIGCDPRHCDLVVAGRGVKGRHCRLSGLSPDTNGTTKPVLISDLTARDGLQVNGVPVREGVLNHGDEIRLGEARFRVWVVDEDSPSDALQHPHDDRQRPAQQVPPRDAVAIRDLTPASLAAAEWEVRVAGQMLGPFSTNILATMVQNETIALGDQVRLAGQERWVRVRQLPNLADFQDSRDLMTAVPQLRVIPDSHSSESPTASRSPNGTDFVSGTALAAGNSPEIVVPESPVASAIPLKVSAIGRSPIAKPEDSHPASPPRNLEELVLAYLNSPDDPHDADHVTAKTESASVLETVGEESPVISPTIPNVIPIHSSPMTPPKSAARRWRQGTSSAATETRSLTRWSRPRSLALAALVATSLVCLLLSWFVREQRTDQLLKQFVAQIDKVQSWQRAGASAETAKSLALELTAWRREVFPHLEATASASRPDRQQLMWAVRDDLPQLIAALQAPSPQSASVQKPLEQLQLRATRVQAGLDGKPVVELPTESTLPPPSTATPQPTGFSIPAPSVSSAAQRP